MNLASKQEDDDDDDEEEKSENCPKLYLDWLYPFLILKRSNSSKGASSCLNSFTEFSFKS